MSKNKYDAAIVDHAQTSFCLDQLSLLPLPVIFIAHNVERDIYHRQAKAASGVKRALFLREAALVGEIEGQLAKAASQVWTLTHSDTAYFRSLGARCVRTFGVPAGITVLPSAAERSLNSHFEWDVGLIGTWSWGANAEGLRWFTEKVLPRLPKQLKIGVAGKGAEWLQNSSQVTRLGFVDSAASFLASCKVLCIPSISGGGLQIKTLDAIAAGRPTVATSFALRGIDDVPETVIVADDAVTFAARLSATCAEGDKPSSPAALIWGRDRLERFQSLVKTSVGEVALS